MLTKEELEVVRKASIHKILGIKNNGRDVKIRCPFHLEKTPSCVIRPDNSFHCFGCNVKGRGAIDFCNALGFSFKQSLEELIKYL